MIPAIAGHATPTRGLRGASLRNPLEARCKRGVFMQPCLVQRGWHHGQEGRTVPQEEEVRDVADKEGIDFFLCLPGQSVVLCKLFDGRHDEGAVLLRVLFRGHALEEGIAVRRHRCPDVSTSPDAEQQSAGERSSYVSSALDRLTRCRSPCQTLACRSRSPRMSETGFSWTRRFALVSSV